jgi:rhamnosyl/mannosyltransferase
VGCSDAGNLLPMAAGLPVVSTELGTGTSYINQDGVTGRVVPPAVAQALAGAINGLLRNPDLRSKTGAMWRISWI